MEMGELGFMIDNDIWYMIYFSFDRIRTDTGNQLAASRMEV